MKVCSLYGVGYYYMPGTDICLKLGGYVRFQGTVGTSQQTRPHISALPTRSSTAGSGYGWRTLAVATIDTRQQTAYGTLRTYLSIGFQESNNDGATTAPPFHGVRGFIQIAGFTFGRATSFFDHFPSAARAYFAGNLHGPSTGATGWNVAAYTAQFGNGFSATIALEQSRSQRAVEQTVGTVLPITTFSGLTNRGLHQTGAGSGGLRGYPDLVANLRVDQAWGSAFLGGALHDVSADYYSGALIGLADPTPGGKVGWAVTAATTINLPMISPGSSFSTQFVYSVGAPGYASQTSGGNFLHAGGGNNGFGVGIVTDGLFGGPGTGIELTTAWSVAAAYEHVWRPGLSTSLYGSYFAVSYSAQAVNYMCVGTPLGAALGPTGTCDPSWSQWNIGSRTQWAPVAGLTLGVDVIYNKLNTATFHTAAGVAPGQVTLGALGTGTRSYRDQSSWAGMFRIQRNYHP